MNFAELGKGNTEDKQISSSQWFAVAWFVSKNKKLVLAEIMRKTWGSRDFDARLTAKNKA